MSMRAFVNTDEIQTIGPLGERSELYRWHYAPRWPIDQSKSTGFFLPGFEAIGKVMVQYKKKKCKGFSSMQFFHSVHKKYKNGKHGNIIR